MPGMFYSLASLCVVSWYALNVCVGKNFSVCSRLSGYALNTEAQKVVVVNAGYGSPYLE